MTPIGRGMHALLFLFLSLLWNTAAAEVTAIVDRETLQLGDSFRLIITVTEDEELSTIDLSPLQADFDILQRSTNSQTSFVNGRRSHTKQLHIDLAPRVAGSLQIPSLNVDGTFTRPVTVRVTPAAGMGSADQPLMFEAQVDRQQVYVQGQLLLTLRIKQAINLDNRTISDMQLDNAFVKQLEQVSFQRTINGRNWLIHEIRYAIFPEQSGTLVIPEQVFTAREVVGRRSLFDIGGSGQRLRRATDPIRIDVLARPRHFPASTWLPAAMFSIEEEWSTPPEQLKSGESTTRTIRLRAEGLQGAQLPPTLFSSSESVKFYPDQPQIEELENDNGLVSVRQDSAALVPTREGPLTLPEIRIPWWDTQENRVRYALLPERTINVGAGSFNQSLATPPEAVAPDITAQQLQTTNNSIWLWQTSTAAALLGWLATTSYFLRRRSRTPVQRPRPTQNPQEKVLFKQLIGACENDDPLAARSALQDWVNVSGDRGLRHSGTGESSEKMPREIELKALCAELDAAVYGREAGVWNGSALARALTTYRAEKEANKRSDTEPLSLYPTG